MVKVATIIFIIGHQSAVICKLFGSSFMKFKLQLNNQSLTLSSLDMDFVLRSVRRSSTDETDSKSSLNRYKTITSSIKRDEEKQNDSKLLEK